MSTAAKEKKNVAKGFQPLGDRVFVGAGAKIVGAVTIGSHAKIGANAVVVDDIPAGATAVGVPARIVRIHDVQSKSA